MTLKELMHLLESRFPVDKAEKWDNSGLQTGRKNKEIRRMYIALDATTEVIRRAVSWKADLLLTHHPLTLGGIKNVTAESLTGGKFYTLIQNDICSYAMHTNYDALEMAPLAGSMMKLQKSEILEVTGTDEKGAEIGFGRVGSLVRPVTLLECAELVKTIFQLEHVKIFGDTEQVIQQVAISPGSGKSLIPAAIRKRAEVLITGDIGHHDGLDAVDSNLAIIDAGHYGLEHIFIAQMASFLKKEGKNLEIRTDETSSPFEIV